MRIKWLGHASVLITSKSGIKIITDPYKPGYFARPDGRLFYADIEEFANIVAMTHDHIDHSHIDTIKGDPILVKGSEIKLKGPMVVDGITFRAVPTLHDDCQGKVLGENSVLCFELDGLRICHTGDLGHVLSDRQMSEIGQVDILLLVVGLLRPLGERQFRIDDSGERIPAPHPGYIINADVASDVYHQLTPKITIPIHFSNDRCSFKLAGVETFLLQKDNIKRLQTSEIEIHRDSLPKENQIIVLEPAL